MNRSSRPTEGRCAVVARPRAAVIALAAVLALGLAAPSALACSVTRIPTPQELVTLADVIVRAQAEALSTRPGRDAPAIGASRTQMRFRVLSILKGTLSSTRLVFNGVPAAKDEPNRSPVPYQTARPSADAACVTVEYRQGAEYLLFLKRAGHPAFAQPDELTPYWAPLAPTNEQLFNPGDRWEEWVRSRLRPDRTATPRR